MKRLSLLLLSGLAVAAVAACGGGPKPEPPGPVTANTDSIAEAQRLEAERQAREAAAAKQYVVSHGIDGSRIETVSYGEERPLASGHDEDAWAQNRRDEFEILGGGENLKQP